MPILIQWIPPLANLLKSNVDGAGGVSRVEQVQEGGIRNGQGIILFMFSKNVEIMELTKQRRWLFLKLFVSLLQHPLVFFNCGKKFSQCYLLGVFFCEGSMEIQLLFRRDQVYFVFDKSRLSPCWVVSYQLCRCFGETRCGKDLGFGCFHHVIFFSFFGISLFYHCCAPIFVIGCRSLFVSFFILI